MTYGHLLPKLSLSNTGDSAAPKRLTKKQAGFRGNTGSKNLRLTEQQVLDARARYEFYGWTRQECAQVAGVDEVYMGNLLRYQNRSLLFPDRKNYPDHLRNVGRPGK